MKEGFGASAKHVFKNLGTGGLSKHTRDKFEKTEDFMKMRSGPVFNWIKETYNDLQLALPSRDFSTGFNTLNRCLNDFSNGVAVVAAQPNAGKSTLFVSMMTGLLANEKDTVIFDITLDDPIDKRFAQIMCNISGLHYQQIYSQKSLNEGEKFFYDDARKYFFEEIIDKERYFCFEAGDSFEVNSKDLTIDFSSFERLEETIESARAAFPDKKVVFFVDAYNDLKYDSEYGKLDQSIKQIKQTSGATKIPVLVTAHIRKVENRKKSRLSLDDIKGTKELEASTICGLILENPYNENPLKDHVTIHRNGNELNVIVIRPEKNKVSAWKDPIFYGIDSFRSKLYPVTASEYRSLYNSYYLGE